MKKQNKKAQNIKFKKSEKRKRSSKKNAMAKKQSLNEKKNGVIKLKNNLKQAYFDLLQKKFEEGNN